MTDLGCLWEPIDIGPVRIRNRIACGPSTLLYARDNVVSERHVAYYAERARGGAGLIITEEHAAYAGGLGAFPDACTAYEERAVPALRTLADAVHEHGAACFVQLYGPGAQDSGAVVGDHWQPVHSASPVPSPGSGVVPHALDTSEIAQLVADHAVSAANVERAGMDGVEIHAAHGWLVGQFLSPYFNRRHDAYGGGPRQRCRLVLELLEAVRGAAPTLAVGVQVSIDEHVGPHGIEPDASLEQIDTLAGSGLVDYISISTGSSFSTARTIAAMEAPDVVLARHGRAVVSAVAGRTPVFLVDTIRTVDNAAAAISERAADVAVMTRAHFADPALVRKAVEGRAAETTPCVGENECMVRAFGGRPVACLMNPVMGRERRWAAASDTPAAVSLSVAVVGGGPAGLQAAATLAKQGHRVVLWERSQQLGGHLVLLSQLPGRERWRLAIEALAGAAERAGVDLRVSAEIPADAAPEYDRLLCATGSVWLRTGASAFRPEPGPVPGVESSHVLDVATALQRALADPLALGRRIVIIDESGEYLPLGLADIVSAAGVRVDLITPHAELSKWVRVAQDGTEVLARLASRDVEVTTGLLLSEIDGDLVALREGWSGRVRRLGPVDTVVLSQLRAPHDEPAARLAAAGVQVRLLGDALAPRRTIEVIYEAEKIARELGS